MVICFVVYFWGVRLETSMLVAVDRRCWCGNEDFWVFLDFVKVLQNYDV